jgi:glycine hydroxymethyltransferase
MSLDHGGHLSHGHPKNFSGRFYEIASYGVDPETEMLDLDRIREQALEVRPRLLLAGASAYPRLIDFEGLASIAAEVGARFMVDMAHIAGLVAAGVHPSPVPHADVVTMTTHKTLRGPRGGLIVCTKEQIRAINSAVFPGVQGGPFMHVIAAKAIALREAAEPAFHEYGKNVVANAAALAATLSDEGLRIVSGGTDNHLMLVDVSAVGLTGAAAEGLLGRVGITCNKNLIPYDKEPPMSASGIRIGTAAVTTRGLGVPQMESLGRLIAECLKRPDDDACARRVEADVAELTAAFPIRQTAGV